MGTKRGTSAMSHWRSGVLLFCLLAVPAEAIESCREPIGDTLRVTKTEPTAALQALLSWQSQPGGEFYEVWRCDAAALYPCALLAHGQTGTTAFADPVVPSELYWYQVWAAVDDRFEQNDMRQDSPLLTEGTTTDLIRCPADPDWFQIEVGCVGADLEISLSHDAAEGDIDLRLRDATGAVLQESATAGDEEWISHAVTEIGPHYIEVDMVSDAGALVGSAYELTVGGLSGGGACRPDRYEPNRDAPSARPIEIGRHDGLTACNEGDGLNNDFYAIEVEAGQEIAVSIEFVHAGGDIDLNLYDTFQSRIAESQSSTDNESIVIPSAELTGTYLVQVFLFSPAPCGDGNDYDLLIELR